MTGGLTKGGMNINSEQKNNQDNEFKYNTNISVLDILRDPEVIVKRVEESIIWCNKCHKKFTIELRKKYIRAKCGCLTILIYPPRSDRQNSHLMAFWVSPFFINELDRVRKNAGETEVKKFIDDMHAKATNH